MEKNEARKQKLRLGKTEEFERAKAEWWANVDGQPIVDDCFHGATISGSEFAEEYTKTMCRHGSSMSAVAFMERVCHDWVAALGYNGDGKFEVVMSNYRL